MNIIYIFLKLVYKGRRYTVSRHGRVHVLASKLALIGRVISGSERRRRSNSGAV